MKIAYTSKSVRDNHQRAEIKDNKIIVINKLGKNTLGKFSFGISEWVNLNNGIGNRCSDKKSFLKRKFKESHKYYNNEFYCSCLFERIIDSELLAVEKVTGALAINPTPGSDIL